MTIATVLVAALAGCVHSGGPQADRAYPDSQTPRVAPLFDYDDDTPDATVDTVDPQPDDADYVTYRVRFPSTGDNGQGASSVVGRWLHQPGNRPRRLVILYPIWGHPEAFPVRRLARGIASWMVDTDVFWMRGPQRLANREALGDAPTPAAFRAELAAFAERLRVNVIDLRRILDWAEQRPELDAERSAVIGMSISAFAGSMALSNEPRLAAGVLIMGAAQPGQVLAQCAGDYARIRSTLCQRFGWSQERYRREAGRAFDALNAATGAPWPGPDNVLIIDALLDRCMPREAQDALWQRMGEPRRISLLAGHQFGFLATTPLGFNYINRKVYTFLGERL